VATPLEELDPQVVWSRAKTSAAFSIAPSMETVIINNILPVHPEFAAIIRKQRKPVVA
jgi:hypothetical protein